MASAFRSSFTKGVLQAQSLCGRFHARRCGSILQIAASFTAVCRQRWHLSDISSQCAETQRLLDNKQNRKVYPALPMRRHSRVVSMFFQEQQHRQTTETNNRVCDGRGTCFQRGKPSRQRVEATNTSLKNPQRLDITAKEQT